MGFKPIGNCLPRESPPIYQPKVPYPLLLDFIIQNPHCPSLYILTLQETIRQPFLFNQPVFERHLLEHVLWENPSVNSQSLWLMLSEIHGRKPFYFTPLIQSIRSVKWR